MGKVCTRPLLGVGALGTRLLLMLLVYTTLYNKDTELGLCILCTNLQVTHKCIIANTWLS